MGDGAEPALAALFNLVSSPRPPKAEVGSTPLPPTPSPAVGGGGGYGRGASPRCFAFSSSDDGCRPKRLKPLDREALLRELTRRLRSGDLARLEPRFFPMLEWTVSLPRVVTAQALALRGKFEEGVASSFTLHFLPLSS